MGIGFPSGEMEMVWNWCVEEVCDIEKVLYIIKLFTLIRLILYYVNFTSIKRNGGVELNEIQKKPQEMLNITNPKEIQFHNYQNIRNSKIVTISIMLGSESPQGGGVLVIVTSF